MKKVFIILLIMATHTQKAQAKAIQSQIDPNKIGVIADIHAGSQKIRKENNWNIVYPKSAEKSFIKALKDMKKKGVGTVMSLGDQTNDQPKYFKKLQKDAQKLGMKMLWAEGNHDQKGLAGDYYQDIGNDRVVMLDEQMNRPPTDVDWVSEVLKTNKNVVIGMHNPIYDRYTTNVTDSYKPLEQAFEKAGNVKDVYSGHWHNKWDNKLNGINYHGVPALTLGKKLNYQILNLP